jgi:predicted RNase H-related nuclease YkuK (DUF458 family)
MRTFEQMINDANEEIRKAHKDSAVYIGCDSLRFKKGKQFYAKYSVVIILHKEQRHGGKLFHSLSVEKDYGNLRQRLMNEAQIAIQAVEGVMDACLENDIPIHVHLDLNPNPNHKSNIAVKEACGWVLGATGIQADIKPNSWAASSAADHAVRGKLPPVLIESIH